jgi:putative transposase
MKSYQKKVSEVKESIEIINSEAILEKAGEGLLNLSIELGFEVLRQMLELDVTELAGEKGRHSKNRTSYRHGSESTKVVLGGEKRSIQKPRVRSLGGVELSLPTLSIFQDEEPLSRAVLSRLLCGVSTRKYERTLDAAAEERSCASKSEVSRRFVSGLESLMEEFFARPITNDYPVIMIDGVSVGEMMVVAAMGIASDGRKQVLGLVEGATENHIVVKSLLSDLISRGLTIETPRLFVLDGGKGLSKAVHDTLGGNALIQRCQVHKKRNVLSHLPESEQTNTGLAISRAYMEFDYDKAKLSLELIADNLENRYPKAAASLREGLDETLTVHRLKVPGLLRQTLATTNPLESANSVARSVVRRVTSWKDGEHIIRTLAAGFMEAEKGFRRIKGYRQIPLLTTALYNCLDTNSSNCLAKLA